MTWGHALPTIILRRLALAVTLPLLLTACGSGNPDSLVGKDINMNAIVDTNATDTNVEEAQYPQASNASEAPAGPAEPTRKTAMPDNSADTVQPGQDVPPSDSAGEPPTTQSNVQ